MGAQYGLAYVLILRLRDYLCGTPWHNLEIETLRRRLFKIGARVRETSRRIWVHLASSYPELLIVASRIEPLVAQQGPCGLSPELPQKIDTHPKLMNNCG